jgi:hypothetical protein
MATATTMMAVMTTAIPVVMVAICDDGGVDAVLFPWPWPTGPFLNKRGDHMYVDKRQATAWQMAPDGALGWEGAVRHHPGTWDPWGLARGGQMAAIAAGRDAR